MPSLRLTEKDHRFLKALFITPPVDEPAGLIYGYPYVIDESMTAPRHPSPEAVSEVVRRAYRQRSRRAAAAPEVDYEALAGTLRQKDAAVLSARRWRCAFAFLAGFTLAALFVAVVARWP